MAWKFIENVSMWLKKPSKLELAKRERQKMLGDLEKHMRREAQEKLSVTSEGRAVWAGTHEPYSKGKVVEVEIRGKQADKTGGLSVPESSRLHPRENFVIDLWEGGSRASTHEATEMTEVKRRITRIIRSHLQGEKGR